MNNNTLVIEEKNSDVVIIPTSFKHSMREMSNITYATRSKLFKTLSLSDIDNDNLDLSKVICLNTVDLLQYADKFDWNAISRIYPFTLEDLRLLKHYIPHRVLMSRKCSLDGILIFADRMPPKELTEYAIRLIKDGSDEAVIKTVVKLGKLFDLNIQSDIIDKDFLDIAKFCRDNKEILLNKNIAKLYNIEEVLKRIEISFNKYMELDKETPINIMKTTFENCPREFIEDHHAGFNMGTCRNVLENNVFTIKAYRKYAKANEWFKYYIDYFVRTSAGSLNYKSIKKLLKDNTDYSIGLALMQSIELTGIHRKHLVDIILYIAKNIEGCGVKPFNNLVYYSFKVFGYSKKETETLIMELHHTAINWNIVAISCDLPEWILEKYAVKLKARNLVLANRKTIFQTYKKVSKNNKDWVTCLSEMREIVKANYPGRERLIKDLDDTII